MGYAIAAYFVTAAALVAYGAALARENARHRSTVVQKAHRSSNTG